MATFVLVHGAMLGGWCWRDVRDMLTARRHDVHTPTLTGQGERRHVLTEDVDLTTHALDVVNTLNFRDLKSVHLVLHGYAGVLAGPIAQSTDRIASVIHLGSYLVGPGNAIGAHHFPSDAALDTWGITDPAARQWAQARLCDVPQRWFTQTVAYDPAPLSQVRQVYVRHTQPGLPGVENSWRRAVSAGWETHEIACGHAMMIAAPRQTARLLESAGPGDALPAVFPAVPRIALW